MANTPRLMRSPLTDEVYIATKYRQHPDVPGGWVADEKFPVSLDDLRFIGFVPELELESDRGTIESALEILEDCLGATCDEGCVCILHDLRALLARLPEAVRS